MEWVANQELIGPFRPSPRGTNLFARLEALKDWNRRRAEAGNPSASVNLSALLLGEKAVPQLTNILHRGSKLNRVVINGGPSWLRTKWPWGQKDHTMKERAMQVLATLGGLGSTATPELLRLAQDQTERFLLRERALSTLHQIHADPSLVSPVLDKLKTDPVMSAVANNYASLFQTYVKQNPILPLKSNSPISSPFLTQTSLWNSANPRWENPPQSLTNVSLIRP